MNTSLFLVDYKGDVCNDTKQYMKDFCVDKAIEKESIKKVGCTTPYGPNKSQICNNKNDADAAYKIYHDKREKYRHPSCASLKLHNNYILKIIIL